MTPSRIRFVAVSVSFFRGLALLLLLAAGSMPLAAQTATQRSTGASGLPLPRFASLAAPEVNVRTGPSMDHPVRWVYSRLKLPVRIVEEYDVWRRIEDPDGETGWTHSSLLSQRRTVLVRGSGVQEMRRSPAADARVVARVEPGVIGELVDCTADWCSIEVADERGWLPRVVLWGTADGD